MKTKLIAALIAATAFGASNANAEVKVSTKGGLKVSTDTHQFQLGGRIQYDYNRAELNGVVDEDQFDLRRGRIYVKGNVSEDWHFKAQFNLDGSGAEDLYLRYTGWGKGAVLTLGNQLQPFGLQELVSSKDVPILERSAINELFERGREASVQLAGSGFGLDSTYTVSAFTEEQGDSSDEEFGFAGRFTAAPIKQDRSVLHLGVSYLDVGEVDAFGIEAGYTLGSFHAQAEYHDGTFEGVDADGYYLQLGYILTGETRPYKNGVFKKVKPSSKSGAWEVVARYEDGNGEFDDIELGDVLGAEEADSIALGLNYYLNNNVRIGASYTDGENKLTGDDGNEFRVRFQIAY